VADIAVTRPANAPAFRVSGPSPGPVRPSAFRAFFPSLFFSPLFFPAPSRNGDYIGIEFFRRALIDFFLPPAEINKCAPTRARARARACAYGRIDRVNFSRRGILPREGEKRGAIFVTIRRSDDGLASLPGRCCLSWLTSERERERERERKRERPIPVTR